MEAADQPDRSALPGTPDITSPQLPTSLSDVQLVEAFFALERQLDAALTAANHPSFTPEVCSCFIMLCSTDEANSVAVNG